MDSHEKITSDEALLLAYAAGELEAEQLSQLESRLAADASLRSRALEVRADYEQAMQFVARLDGTEKVDSRNAMRQVGQLIHQWEVEQAQMPAPIPLHRRRPPKWSYAAAAIIALLIGFCFWWANNAPTLDVPVQLAENTDTSQPTQDVAMNPPTFPQVDVTPVQMPLAFQDNSSENSDRINDIEKDVVALSDDQSTSNNLSGDVSQ